MPAGSELGRPMSLGRTSFAGKMIVATADIHYTKSRRKKFKREIKKLERAIAFVVAGDVTAKGGVAEAYWFSRIFADVKIPKLFVLGNHDYWLYKFAEGKSKYLDFYEHLDRVVKAMKANGFRHLFEEPVVIGDVAFCGVCGWYDGTLEEFAELSEEERELKKRIISSDSFHIPEYVRPEKLIERDLATLEAQYEEVSDAPFKVCVLHHSPVAETLSGCNKVEYAFMGSRRFFEITQKFDLVLHGHAHCGRKDPVKVGNTAYLNVSFELHGEFVEVYI